MQYGRRRDRRPQYADVAASASTPHPEGTTMSTPTLLSRFDDEREPEPFELKSGNAITGTLVSVEDRSSDYGGPYKYLVIDSETDGKLYGVPAWHYGLRSKLAELRPQLGERIRIRVGEKVRTAAGQSFQKYDVRVDRPVPARVDYAAEEQLVAQSGPLLSQMGDVLPLAERARAKAQPATPFEDDDDDLPF